MSDLAGLLTGLDARAALARRDIAVVYRLLTEAGVSQACIAHATGQSQSEVSAVIAGRRVQSIAVLERIADGLGVPRGWMGMAYADGLGPEHRPEEQTSEEDQGRNLLRHAATVMFGEPIFGVPQPIKVWDASTPQWRRISRTDVECVAAATDRLEWLFGDFGGLPISAALTAHAYVGERLLRGDMSESIRKQLLITLADLHTVAGGAAVDAGLRERGRQHFARGMSCAAAASYKPGVSKNLRAEGQTEMYFGEPEAALKLFQLGAATSPTALFRAVFEDNASLALALLGLPEESQAAMSRAHQAFDTIGDDDSRRSMLAALRAAAGGTTHLVLGCFDFALPELTAAIDVSTHAKRCSTINLTKLATAQLRAGELRDGVQTATSVIGKAKELRSVLVRQRLGPLQRAAAARRDSTCQDLARELATLRAAA
jgi:transcriptional regulator with XRE-family HTH domain